MEERSVYFIRNRLTGNVKIGVSALVGKRLSELQTGSDGDLELIRTEIGDEKHERALHGRFASERLRGEWFKTDGSLGEYLGIEPMRFEAEEVCEAYDPRWSRNRYLIANRVTGWRWDPVRLAIMPEPNLLACLCDWQPEDGCPVAYYADQLRRMRDWSTIKEQGWVPICWSVCFEGNGSWLSPFPNPDMKHCYGSDHTWFDQDFTCPIDADTREPIDWYSLPIQHRFPAFWRALGFDPSPFQTRFDLRPVFARAG